MECPFCGMVMYEGYVRASATRMYKGDIYWQDEKDSHKKLWLSENRIPLEIDHYEDLFDPCIKAHACPRCKKIILDSYMETSKE